jgi:exonuclease SbcC
LLDHLSYSVTFPSTARTLKGDVDFKTGFGTITGANESGKSFIIEVARWCLFGTAALRGRADDYKTLKATLQFQVKGDSYEVRRTHNSVKLTKGDTLVATGTKPVNEHILGLLGFGLEVFDVACAANQGDVEKLSAMKPAERKRMVDQVIGLDRIEELAKWCGDEAKMFERQVVDPGSEPTAPAEEWDEALLKRAQAAFEEMHQIRGLLSVSRRPPVEPTTTVTATAEYWKGLADQERELRAELKMLQIRLRALPSRANTPTRNSTRSSGTSTPSSCGSASRRSSSGTPGPPGIASSCWSCATTGPSLSRPEICIAWSRSCAPTARSTARTASITSISRAGG